MTRFIVIRAALLVAGLLVASILIFFTLRILPGDVALVIGGTQASPERIAAIRAQLGLDQPIVVQYLDWVGGLLRLDLGTSVVTGSSVSAQIAQKLAVTGPLALLSLLFGLVIALPLGFLSAVRRSRASGVAIAFGAQAAAAVPVVWAGLLLILLLSTALGLFPSQGFPLNGWADPWGALRSLILPALTIGIVEGAVLLRFVRSAVLSAQGQLHVTAAAARGLTRRQALLRHGLPNAGLSVVSVLGLQLAALIVGAVVVEQLFNLPGLGPMLVTDVGQRDLPKVQSVVFTITAIILVVGFLVDLVHRIVDPRLRAGTA